jgi:hypothetical protein
MNRKLRYIYLLSLVSGLLWSESIGSDKQGLHPVNLEVYDGAGSLLLHWSFADTIQSNEISIFRRSAQEEIFTLISSITKDTDRFLDKNCNVSERYFYTVKVKDINGVIYRSDDIRPSFGTCLQGLEKNKIADPSSMWNLMSHVIDNSFTIYYPEISDKPREGLLNLLSKDNIDKSSWIEDFPLQYLSDIKLIIDNPANMVFQDYIVEEMFILGKEYRNDLLLTPEEWTKGVNDLFSLTKDKWYMLVDSFQKCLEKLKNSPPILISGAEKSGDNNIETLVFVIDPERLGQRKINLYHNDETIKVNIQNTLFPVYEVRVETPGHWDYATLSMGDQVMDRIDFISDRKIMKTLENDIIPVESVTGIRASKEKTELWLNEIFWDPNIAKLSLEVAGQSSGSKTFFISINNDDLWEIHLDHSFDIQYSDSTFYIDLSKYDDALNLYFDILDNERRSVELFRLTSTDLISSHRFPDGETWKGTDKNTFGEENTDQWSIIDASLIPEFFVLYQNYPNPFNSNTRISFDLLQDATLSLYVTDATGRVKTIFSEEEFYNSGKYNFDWNAESFSTGVYFFTINAEINGYLPVIFSRKMIYLK